MKRVYKKPPKFSIKQVATGIFVVFVLFIAYVILEPPNEEIARIESPDGSKEARLRRFQYTSEEPTYRVYYRESGKWAWLNLLQLPGSKIENEVAQIQLEWSTNSERLYLHINEAAYWHHTF